MAKSDSRDLGYSSLAKQGKPYVIFIMKTMNGSILVFTRGAKALYQVPIFYCYRNQSNYVYNTSIDWFLYEWNIGTMWVRNFELNSKILFFISNFIYSLVMYQV